MRLLKRTDDMMHGEDVLLLQEMLESVGYHIEVDGWFGPSTYDCVKDFQSDNGLVVDGIVGPKTMGSIKDILDCAVYRNNSETENIYIGIVRKEEVNGLTLGEIHIEGELECYTLENPWKENKRSLSCVPEGTYNAYVRSNKKSKWSYDVIEFFDVPNRTNIQIHRGNYEEDTRGCILVGTSISKDKTAVWDSETAMNGLMEKVMNKYTNRNIYITIVNDYS